jgi:hypothetical protein
MSRRHHGNRPHRSSGPPRPTDAVRSGPEAPATAANPLDRAIRSTPTAESSRAEADHAIAERPPSTFAAPTPRPVSASVGPGGIGATMDPSPERAFVRAADAPPNGEPRAAADRPEPVERGQRPEPHAIAALPSCTAPQLRRFIKSRPYVPMHELRRRFGINGTEDEVSSIDLGATRVYVGLPPREGLLLGELLRGGDIGYELSLDPRTPIVIGLYPMRPVARS